MGIPLLSGRYFTEEDNGDRPPLAIVSAVLAAKYFPDRSPIGQRLMIDDTDAEPRAVEIAADRWRVSGKPPVPGQQERSECAGLRPHRQYGQQHRRLV